MRRCLIFDHQRVNKARVFQSNLGRPFRRDAAPSNGIGVLEVRAVREVKVPDCFRCAEERFGVLVAIPSSMTRSRPSLTVDSAVCEGTARDALACGKPCRTP